MQIIGACFKNTSRVYSYYCTVEDVKVGDVLLTPDDTIVTVAALDVDPATISERVAPLMKTITKRAEEAAEVVIQTGEEIATSEQPTITIAELIVIKQLPVIEDQLRSIKTQWEEKLSSVQAMECTEKNVGEAKKIRRAMRKQFEELDTQRKKIKELASAPIKQFDDTFKECVTNIFDITDGKLKSSIDLIEDGIKNKTRSVIAAYYNSEIKAAGLDFPPFESSGIKIGLSDTESSLKKQVEDFVTKTADEVAMISGLPYADEIMVEYRNTLNASRSVTTINERHKAIEAQRARMETVSAQPTFEPIPVAAAIPRVIVATHADDEITKTIRITGSQRKIDALVQFLEDGWYKYEVEA